MARRKPFWIRLLLILFALLAWWAARQLPPMGSPLRRRSPDVSPRPLPLHVAVAAVGKCSPPQHFAPAFLGGGGGAQALLTAQSVLAKKLQVKLK